MLNRMKTVRRFDDHLGFHLSLFMGHLATFLWDKGKQHSPRFDAAEFGVPSGAILFA